MKFIVFSKVLLDYRTVDEEGLKKISNSFFIKSAVKSNEAYYDDQLYTIWEKGHKPEYLSTQGYQGNEPKLNHKDICNDKIKRKKFY